MKLHIDDTKKIEDIKTAFNHSFKFLNLGFFTKSHKIGEPSAKRDLIDDEKTLAEIRQKHTAGDLLIDASMLVSEVESAFENQFGVHVQVFRKQNDVWLETTNTDNWTLEKQNETGKFMSSEAEE